MVRKGAENIIPTGSESMGEPTYEVVKNPSINDAVRKAMHGAKFGKEVGYTILQANKSELLINVDKLNGNKVNGGNIILKNGIDFVTNPKFSITPAGIQEMEKHQNKLQGFKITEERIHENTLHAELELKNSINADNSKITTA